MYKSLNGFLEGFSKNYFTVLLVYIFCGFLCFSNILNNNYFSDDFNVIRRITVYHSIWAPGFFRPLSDVSMKWIVFFFNDSPFYQYLFNVLVLIISGFGIFRLSLIMFNNRFLSSPGAFFAGLFFIIYPFHNEAIVWVVGRASLLSGFFSICSLLTVFSGMKIWQRIFLSNLFYFIALSAYESAFPLPGIILLLLYNKNKKISEYYPWLFSFIITLVIHFILRLITTDTFFGNYQQDGLALSFSDYFINYFKALYRLFVVPVVNETTITLLAISLLTVSFCVLRFVRKYRHPFCNMVLFKLSCSILLSLIIPAIFSVSVKTSEGDRLLFFPSIFFVLFITYLLQSTINGKLLKKTVFLGITVYFITFLLVNNSNWHRASSVISSLKEQLEITHTKAGRVCILNLPDSYNGAYIFRNGFDDFLLSNNFDTAKIGYMSKFMNWDYASTENPLQLKKEDGNRLAINNYTVIEQTRDSNIYKIVIKDTSVFYKDISKENVWFWDKTFFKPLLLK